MDPMVWAVALLVAACSLCFLEMFIPSMGIITAVAMGCAVGSSSFAFGVDSTWGSAFIVLNVVGMICSFAIAFRLLPRSPLAVHNSDVEDARSTPEGTYQEILGKTGVAFTDLRPGGTAMIDGCKVDVVAQGGYIDEGARVKVLKIEGNKIVVERTTI